MLPVHLEFCSFSHILKEFKNVDHPNANRARQTSADTCQPRTAAADEGGSYHAAGQTCAAATTRQGEVAGRS